MLASLNTDDPAVQGVTSFTSIPWRRRRRAEPEQIRQAQINGLTLAFLGEQEKGAPHSRGLLGLITKARQPCAGPSDQAEAWRDVWPTPIPNSNQGHYLNRLAGRDSGFPLRR